LSGAGPAPARSLALAAPAKINLFLHVLGRRDDGYHLLDSLIAFARLGDRIEVAPAPGLSLTVEGPFAAGLSAGEDNLALRAARALADRVRPDAGAAIRLTKNLPVASGIGGGSADAAATLRALVRLWRLDLDADALARLGLRLGADVPICLFGRPARVGGIGETIMPAPALPAVGVVLVNPRVPVSTGAVFSRLGGRYSRPASPMPGVASVSQLADWLAEQRNDLEAPALSLAPSIGDVLAALSASGQCLLARLSGSGATCFGLYPDGSAAASAARALGGRHADWWVAATGLADGAPSRP
jgi:4-diphosphocytidyl-2-C-methyl-D-erythritol kinase